MIKITNKDTIDVIFADGEINFLEPTSRLWNKAYKIGQTEQCIIHGVSGSFSWTTECYHNDNDFTMTDFLENHLQDDAEIYLEDGSYAEVRIDNTNYALDAKGNGNSYNHIIEWTVV